MYNYINSTNNDKHQPVYRFVLFILDTNSFMFGTFLLRKAQPE